MKNEQTKTEQTKTEQTKTETKPTIWNGIDGKPIGCNHNIGPNELSIIISAQTETEIDQKTVRNFLRSDPITSSLMPTDGSNMFWTIFRNGTELMDHIVYGFISDRKNRLTKRLNRKSKQAKIKNRKSYDMVNGKIVETTKTDGV